MIKLITEVVARLTGKTTVHAQFSEIKGSFSGGQRDSNGKDWRQ